MLIKELSKNSKIPAKDLLVTPTGLLCYIADCLKSGLYLDEIIDRIIDLNIPDNEMLESINNREVMEKVITDYENIASVISIYNLC